MREYQNLNMTTHVTENKYGTYIYEDESAYPSMAQVPRPERYQLPPGAITYIPDEFIPKEYCKKCHCAAFLEEQNKLIEIIKMFGAKVS